MFNGIGNYITSIPNAVARLKAAKDGQEFSSLLSGLRTFLKTLDSSPQCLMELEQRAYYVMIENPQLFRNIYENKVKGKQIHIVIHQPKIL